MRVYLETEAAQETIDRCLNSWYSRRKYHPRAKMLVVAPSQNIAKGYQKYLKRKTDMRVGIAIHDSDDPQGEINRFNESYSKSDALDILITVAMAYEGMNVPSITHIACLTRFRSKQWLIQLFARGNRHDHRSGKYSDQKCFIFVPQDAKVMFTAFVSLVYQQESGFVSVNV